LAPQAAAQSACCNWQGTSLSLQDHLIDTLQTRFAGVTALEVVQVEEHVFYWWQAATTE